MSKMRQLLQLFVISIISSANAVASCQPDFHSFIRRFENNPRLQLSQTKFPLIYRSIDHDDPLLKMQQVLVEKSEVDKYEHFPSTEYQRKLKVTKKLKSTKINQCSVIFNVPDSDMYAFEFKFKRQAAVWLLIEVEDNSL